jgi:hypothetical protein
MDTPTGSTQQGSATGPLALVDDNDRRTIDVESSSEQEEQGDVPASSGLKRKLRSNVWSDFEPVEVDGVSKAKCKHCKKKLSGITKNGTSHLRAHLKSCVYNQKKKGVKLQTNLRLATSEKGQVAVENYVFNQDVARRALYFMIILHEYPLSIVDHHGFRKFVSALQPLFKLGTRNTIRRDIMSFYEGEKRKARIFLQKTDCRVAVTTDLWTADNQKRGYMAVTGYFIDDSWTLKSCILR